jgi:hypothetical protein
MISYIAKQNGELKKVESLDQATWVNVYPPFEHGELDRYGCKP